MPVLMEKAFVYLIGFDLTGQQLLNIGQIDIEIVRMGDGLKVTR